jgi:predicted  nucleic acid-binding Zn-ribbon protein
MDMAIVIDLNKAKGIAHDKRRAARSAEFAPLDIKATIPSEAAAAEAARQAIREKYASLQAQMDAAQTADELKALLPEA